MKPDLPQGVEQLQSIAKEAGLSLAQFSLAWVLREPNVASAITGASRPDQVLENAQASNQPVDPDLFALAEKIIADAKSKAKSAA